jgi:hypothetical protein|nr:hypothetical protein [Neorhizobium tomejilense]
MHTYDTALALLLSPIARGSALVGIGRGYLSKASGIPSDRIRDIYAKRGDEPTIEEVARLAAIVDQEVSIVPESCGARAFTEVEEHAAFKGDRASHGMRVVDMLEKVSDLCIDMRLSTGMSNAAFERTHGVGSAFMAKLADFSRNGSISICEIHAYLAPFGATLATFPRTSEYTNYYVALAAEASASQAPMTMKAA